MMQLTRNFDFVALVGLGTPATRFFWALRRKTESQQLAAQYEAPSRVTKMSALGTKRPQAERGILRSPP